MEAMAVERIVLGSNITGIKEVLKEFPECLFQAGNIDNLEDKIEFIKNMSLVDRKVLARAMRTYVERELSIKIFLTNHEILYLNLIK